MTTDERPPLWTAGSSTVADRISAVLRAFAQLSPATERSSLDVTAGGNPLIWLGNHTTLTDSHTSHDMFTAAPQTVVPNTRQRVPRSPALERIAALDALHAHEQLLREGWVFIAGTTTIDGDRRRVCVPLLARPVQLFKAFGSFSIGGAGDLELTPLVTDPQLAAKLEGDAQFGGGSLSATGGPSPRLLQRMPKLTNWIRAAADAAGLPVADVLPWTEDPAGCRSRDGLVAIVGAGLHLARDVGRPGLGDVLREWSRAPDLPRTAFGRLYAGHTAGPIDTDEPVESPLPLTATQRAVVRRSRHEGVVAVSGAPGNGKSHAVAAIAIDAVARGQSVLVATPSRYAADVISELLQRQPGPDPVLFGSTTRRRDLAADLADGVRAVGRQQLTEVHRRHLQATRRLADTRDAVATLLEQEADAQRLPVLEGQLPVLRRAVPGVFEPDTGLDAVESDLDLLDRAPLGVIDHVRRWLARRRLQLLARHGDEPVERVRRALDGARCVRAAATLAADGGTRIGALWDELFAAERVAAERLGDVLSLRAALGRAQDRRRVEAVAALAAALRSGRARRREQLRMIDAAAMSAALPLWVGALTDIDDLLPPQPAMFDLLILDEASQIDQPRAAPALLRAARAVVVGDPRQLRHVSFVADAEQRRVLDEVGIAGSTAQLDVRRMSAFDAAAAATPVTFLDEHHRSVPHLIGFSARRFYANRVRLRTRHPANESLDAIEIVTVPDAVHANDHVAAEVTRVLAVIDHLDTAGWRSIGVISPFRGQADALEAAVLERYDLDDIERLGLRVGTAHAFQGAERDVIVVALGLTDDDAPQRRRFVEDPNLCNVLITRARHRMVIVTGLTDYGDGLLADYLAYGDSPPVAADEPSSATGWTARLADELRAQGGEVRHGYRVGDHVVDLVVGPGPFARAIECRVHPDGVGAHIDRRRLLHDAAWDVVEAWPSRYDHDVIGATMDILAPRR